MFDGTCSGGDGEEICALVLSLHTHTHTLFLFWLMVKCGSKWNLESNVTLKPE